MTKPTREPDPEQKPIRVNHLALVDEGSPPVSRPRVDTWELTGPHPAAKDGAGS